MVSSHGVAYIYKRFNHIIGDSMATKVDTKKVCTSRQAKQYVMVCLQNSHNEF